MLTGLAALIGLLLFIFFGTAAFKVISILLWSGLGFVAGFLIGCASASWFLCWLGAILMGLTFGYGAWRGHQVVRFISGGLVPFFPLVFCCPNPGSDIRSILIGCLIFGGNGLAALKWPKYLQTSYTTILTLMVFSS